VKAIDFGTIELQWGRPSHVQRIYSIPRSTLYTLVSSGAVRSRRINGARYIDIDSLKELFENAPEKPSKAVSREMRKRARASVKKRASVKNRE
jgi:hypothetical protein